MRIKLARTVQLGIFSRALSISSVYFVMLVRVLILDSEIEWLQLHTNITLRFVLDYVFLRRISSTYLHIFIGALLTYTYIRYMNIMM